VCCNALSDRLKAVSIRMAKEQNLSLNSLKISGQCGRLLCCLAFENDWYTEARRSLPVEGTTIRYDGATFHVSSLNLIGRTVQISGDDGRTLEIPAARFVHAGAGRWQISE
jgi:cell fate regulator YaaT (PSP1 superfamily)